MSSQLKIVSLILLLSLILCQEQKQERLQDVKINEYSYSLLSKETEQFVLTIDNPKVQKMAVELSLTFPSSYEITFNQYNMEEYVPIPAETSSPKLRQLSTEYTSNQTNLILSDTYNNGKNRVILSLTEEIKKVVVTVIRKENAKATDQHAIFLRYKIKDFAPEGYYVKNPNISSTVEKDYLNISFGGVSQYKDDTKNSEDFTVRYYIKVYDKETLNKKIENIYLHYLIKNETPLLVEEYILKGEAAGKNNYLRIKAKLNDKKEQILLINAVASVKDHDEEVINYKVVEFKVQEESKDNDGKKDGDGKNDGDGKKVDGKEVNEKTFFIILIAFGGIVILTFIFVMIFICIKGKKDTVIEEEEDYKNVGQIRTINEDEN